MEETGTNVCDMGSFEQDDECALDCQQTAKCSGYSNQCPGGGRVNYTDGNFVEGSCSWDGGISYYQCDCTLEVTETEEVSMEETGRNVCGMNDFQQNDECSTDCNVTQGYNDGKFIEGSCTWDGGISRYDCICEKDRAEYTEAVENQPPTADDDGTVDAGICADSDGLIIDVLDNDDDPDNDSLSIDSVESPSNGTTVIIDDNGTDKILYTPSSAPDTVTFDYTVSDGNDNTDTATVTVDVTDGGCGSLTVKVEDPDGNPIPGATVEPLIGGTHVPQVTGPDGTAPYNVEISDTPILTQMNETLLGGIPDGFSTDPSSITIDKSVQKTQGQDEPDDHTYQNITNKKSKLATDPSGDDDDNGGGGTTETYQGYGYQSCHFCHTGDAYTYIESFEADVTKTTNPDGSVDFNYDNEEYTGWNTVSGNSSACTQQIEADTVSCYERWTDAKGSKDPTWNPPGSYCKQSGSESSCYPNTDWPEETSSSNQTCDSYTVIEPYPNCPPGAEKRVYGYDTCEKRCVRTSSP